MQKSEKSNHIYFFENILRYIGTYTHIVRDNEVKRLVFRYWKHATVPAEAGEDMQISRIAC